MSFSTRIYSELRGDRVIWMILALLAIFSIVIVYSATGTLAFQFYKGDTGSFLAKHTLILVAGLFLTYLCYLMHPMRYSRMASTLFLISIPLLAYTLLIDDTSVNSARRWIAVPYTGLNFQTSEFAKIALMIYLAKVLSVSDYIKDFNSAFMPIIVPVIIICGLIAPANGSTAVLLFICCMAIMFVGRVDMKYIILLILCGVVLFAFLFLIGEVFPDNGVIRSRTWISRVRDFMLSDDGGYQVQQSKMAIASGGIFGVGPGNSWVRNFLPAPYSDFIFSIICEEYGLFGAFLIIVLYLLLLFRVTRLVTVSNKGFGAMLALGLTFLIVIQAIFNMAVAVHLVPVTGLNLPLISYGGTSLLFTCISFGIILSVSKNMEAINETDSAGSGGGGGNQGGGENKGGGGGNPSGGDKGGSGGDNKGTK